MRILTCNVRCQCAPDGANNWCNRSGCCCEVMLSRSPDIICLQEAWREQALQVRDAFEGFEWLATVDETTGDNPLNSILYRSAAFERISVGGYWLSETPHVSGSKSWGSDCVRLANWVRLRDRASGKELRVVNTHLDHVSQLARENQARMINEDAAAYPADYPQVLTGDMNADASNPAVASLLAAGWRDTYEAAHGVLDPGRTFHEFLGEDCRDELGKIDWILKRGNVKATGAEIIRDSRAGRFPSDHYFVSADVELA